MAKRRYSTYRVRDQTTEFESTKNFIPAVMGIYPYGMDHTVFVHIIEVTSIKYTV